MLLGFRIAFFLKEKTELVISFRKIRVEGNGFLQVRFGIHLATRVEGYFEVITQTPSQFPLGGFFFM